MRQELKDLADAIKKKKQKLGSEQLAETIVAIGLDKVFKKLFADLLQAIKEENEKKYNGIKHKILQRIGEEADATKHNNKELSKIFEQIKEKEIVIPEWPKSVSISNFPKPPEYPSQIKIVKPDWFKQFDTADFFRRLNAEVNRANGLTWKSEISTHESPNRAIAVKPVDDRGRTIDLRQPVVIQGGGGGAAGAPDPVGLKNTDGVKINPATSDNQLADGHSIVIKDSDSDNKVAINADGQLHVVLMGKVDDNNSSSTPLDADAVFTGSATDILDFGFIFVTVFSDVASATDGLSMQQSSDGTNWDNTDEYTVPAGTGKTYSFQPGARYFRVVYTNGGTGQSSFRLQTVLKKTSSLASSHRIQDSIVDDDDAELIKAVITGKNPQGTFVNFQSTTAGNFKMSLEELESGVSDNSNSQLKVTPYDSSGNELIKLEDIAHGSGDAGIMPLAVRNDTIAALAGTDGDYIPFTTDEDGALWTHKHKSGTRIDSGNSTTTPLSAAGVFTGAGVDCLGSVSLTITLATDVDSATNGMTFQFSTDNSNWDDIYQFEMDVSESGTRRFQFPITARYFRVVYTNGASDQTYFRVQTLLHADNQLTSIHRLKDNTADDRSAQIVKAAIIAQQAGGSDDFIPVQATNGGNLKMSVEEFDSGALGQDTMANSLPVTIASDQTVVPAGFVDPAWTFFEKEVNATGDTEILAAAGADTKYIIHYVEVNNLDDDDATQVEFQEDGSANHISGLGRKYIPSNGGERYWDHRGKGITQPTANTAIDINVAGANKLLCMGYYETVAV